MGLSTAGSREINVTPLIAVPAGPDEPAVVHHVLPCTGQLIRRAAGRAEREQGVAANVDTCISGPSWETGCDGPCSAATNNVGIHHADPDDPLGDRSGPVRLRSLAAAAARAPDR
jgi:hypothetical protein